MNTYRAPSVTCPPHNHVGGHTGDPGEWCRPFVQDPRWRCRVGFPAPCAGARNATRAALRAIAARVQNLDAEIAQAYKRLEPEPIPASSGRTDRHRLNRGGDRAAAQGASTAQDDACSMHAHRLLDQHGVT